MPAKPTDEQWTVALDHVLWAERLAESWHKQYPQYADEIHTAMLIGLAYAAACHNPKRGKFSTLLTRCVRHRIVRAIKGLRTLKRHHPVRKTYALQDDVPCYDPAPAFELDGVRQWLDILPERERRLVALHVFEDLTYVEIGRRENMTPQNAHHIVTQSLDQLRQDWRVLALQA